MRVFTPIGLCGCLLLLACSDDGDGPDPDSKVPVDMNLAEISVDLPTTDQSIGPDGSVTTTMKGKITVDGFDDPISDMDICLYKDGKITTDCTKTSATGEWSFDVPMHEDVGLLFDKAGFEGHLLALYLTLPPTTWNTVALSDAKANTEYAKVNVSYPPKGKGHIVVNGAEIAIAVVPKAGVGPYYGAVDNGPPSFDKSLTQSPATGGWGEIMDLPPGTYDLDVTHATKTCTNAVGWPPKQGHTLRVPVLDGYFTSAWVDCK